MDQLLCEMMSFYLLCSLAVRDLGWEHWPYTCYHFRRLGAVIRAQMKAASQRSFVLVQVKLTGHTWALAEVSSVGRVPQCIPVSSSSGKVHTLNTGRYEIEILANCYCGDCQRPHVVWIEASSRRHGNSRPGKHLFNGKNLEQNPKVCLFYWGF